MEICVLGSLFDNPSQESQQNAKIPPNIQNMRLPEIPLQIPPGILKKYEVRIFWGNFLVFSGYFFNPLLQGEFVCRAGNFWPLWGLWAFLLCSWLVGCQLSLSPLFRPLKRAQKIKKDRPRNFGMKRPYPELSAPSHRIRNR